VHTAKMLQCLLHFARWSIPHSQILNCTLPNLQLHIVKSPFSYLHFYIANLTSLHYFTGCLKFSDCPPTPPLNPMVAQSVFKVFFCPNFVFSGRFLLGWVGACISGLPSYLLAYILTNLHTHLLRLPIHLPSYLDLGPYPHLTTI
jgi:hypothetical protein